MKNLIPQFSIAAIAVIVLTLLMSYTRPVADAPKEYKVVMGLDIDKLAENVKTQMAYNWQPVGGVAVIPPRAPVTSNFYIQAMVK